MEKEIEIRKLTIKTFHIERVNFAKKTYMENRTLFIRDNLVDELKSMEPDTIKNIAVNIITPEDHGMYVNTIMDFLPVAAKVLGKPGEGITHVLTGVCVMLTGVDEDGIQTAEFGSSEGVLNEQVVFGRAGTPLESDIIIHMDVTLKRGMGQVRRGPTAAHKACDSLVQEIRDYLKKINGRCCDEKAEYSEKIKSDKKKVVIIKQVAGQGAMYDTQLFGREPCGFTGGHSIIDMGNIPIIVSPNEYRDGALRAMH